MQAFKIHEQIIADYKDYLKSFNIIRDERIRKVVDGAFKNDAYIPEPLIQFNPSYKKALSIEALVAEGILHSGAQKAFGKYNFYLHQEKALRLGDALTYLLEDEEDV